ncbi:MAG: hypothetical protein K1060chlam5_00786 [Candidatus Anoxychlamydiales bacterium]|nr:hypothetical protein [Candidatus Anoxychlamydiales bacterium]
MTLFKKIAMMTIALLTISSAYAGHNNDCCDPCPPDPCKTCDVPGGPMQSAYSHPARVNVCGSWDMFASASFLYWEPREDGLELGTDRHAVLANTDYARFLDMSFDFKAAFKVLLGYNFEYDNWQTVVRYTRMNMNTSTSATKADAFDLVPAWFIDAGSSPNISKITNKWDLDFNIFDWELGRPFYNGKELTMNLFYGLKTGWIDQNLVSTMIYSSSPVKTTAKSDSWLFGPRLGLNSNFIFCDTFRIFGDFAASLFYQKFSDVKINEELVTDASSLVINTKTTFKNINYATELAIGLGWGTYFDNNNWYFDISAAYELQSYFNQNRMRSLKEGIDFVTGATTDWSKPADLVMHGLTLTARFDF